MKDAAKKSYSWNWQFFRCGTMESFCHRLRRPLSTAFLDGLLQNNLLCVRNRRNRRFLKCVNFFRFAIFFRLPPFQMQITHLSINLTLSSNYKSQCKIQYLKVNFTIHLLSPLKPMVHSEFFCI